MEQQQHLLSLIQQRDELTNQINQLQAQVSEKRDLLLKVVGVIDYLTQIGVSLPQENPVEESDPSNNG